MILTIGVSAPVRTAATPGAISRYIARATSFSMIKQFEKLYYPGFIEYSNTPSRFGTVPGFEGMLPLSHHERHVSPTFGPVAGLPVLGDPMWRSSSMPPAWANVAAHAGFAYLSFRWRRCSSPSARISRICPTTFRPFFSAISRTAFRDSR